MQNVSEQSNGFSQYEAARSAETSGTTVKPAESGNASGKEAETSLKDEKTLLIERRMDDLFSMINSLSKAVRNLEESNSKILAELSSLRRQPVTLRSETKVVEPYEMNDKNVFKGKSFSEKDVAVDKIFYFGKSE